MLSRLVLLTLLFSTLALPLAAQKKDKAEPPAFEGKRKEFTDLALTITLPPGFTDLAEETPPIQYLKQAWRARIGAVSLDITFFVVPLDTFQFTDPEDVLDLRLSNARELKGGDPSFSFTELELVPGSYGLPGYASLGYGGFHQETREVATFYYLGSILEKNAYSLEVRATPKPGPEGHKLILDFLKRGVAFKGKPRDPKWSDAEITERWKKDAPDSLAKKKAEIIRTDHYIVFTNSSGGNKFAEQMELNYTKIKETYPFEDAPGQRLMPVFLFRDSDEYHAFFAKQFKTSLDEARRSKGVAFMDWYATWYEAPRDTVHIHEGTHQIFKNRLRLAGGGSWFQEGVAEYMSEIRNDLNNAARLVRNGKHMPLVQFVKVQSLLFSSKDDSNADAADQYAFAALLIEFLRESKESKFGKDNFQAFVHKVGLAAPNDVPAIERCVQAVYKTDLAGLEKDWIEYCKKRK